MAQVLLTLTCQGLVTKVLAIADLMGLIMLHTMFQVESRSLCPCGSVPHLTLSVGVTVGVTVEECSG